VAEEEEEDEVRSGNPGEEHWTTSQASQNSEQATRGDNRGSQGSTRSRRLMRDLAGLIRSDFTRDIVILIEQNSPTSAGKFKVVPIVNKIDTASDENFIRIDILENHGMDMTKINVIPDDQRKKRTLTGLEGQEFTPEGEVTLFWHKIRDRMQRVNKFTIIDRNAPFDMLIGSAQFSDELRCVLYAIGRRKETGKKLTRHSTLYVRCTHESQLN
jgi:hypothetical protein